MPWPDWMYTKAQRDAWGRPSPAQERENLKNDLVGLFFFVLFIAGIWFGVKFLFQASGCEASQQRFKQEQELKSQEAQKAREAAEYERLKQKYDKDKP